MPIDTSALPAGWGIERVLEIVPSPVDIGMTEPRSLFSRWTYICTNHHDEFVVSDGSEDACYQQALSIAETTGTPNLP